VLTSCSDNDAPAASLEGKWEYFKEGNANSTGQEFLTDYVHQSGCTKDYSIITASTIEDHNFLGSTCVEEIFTTPYTRNGNIISINSEGETFTFEIKILDSSTLKIYASDPNFPGDFDVTVFRRIN
jgi:hypothetical protein